MIILILKHIIHVYLCFLLDIDVVVFAVKVIIEDSLIEKKLIIIFNLISRKKLLLHCKY